ncbi:MAG: T9SS type A sorting domain-containing protein, partial [Flavobacteriales bacterium]
PNNDGIYPLTVFIDARAASFDPLAIGGITGFDVWLTEMGFLLDAFGDPNFTTNGIKLERLALDVRPSGVGVSETNLPVSGVTNYPNPFSGNTTVSFNLTESVEEVTFEVFNVLGTLVYSENVNPTIGKNSILFEGQNHGAGIYFYSLSYDNNTVTKKMILN